MYDLKNCSIIIPFKYDSIERLENLNCLLSYVNNNFICDDIIIGEIDKEQNLFYNMINCDVKLIYVKSESDLFHKTRILNVMLKETKNDIIWALDSDMIISPDILYNAYYLIDNNVYEFVLPYNNKCIHIKDEIRERFIKNLDFWELFKNLDFNNKHLHHTDYMFGGMIFYNKESFIKCGMENENFIGWGFEDDERFHRIRVLNGNIKRLDSYIYHLYHYRNPLIYDVNCEVALHNKKLLLEEYDYSKHDFFEKIKQWGYN